MTTNYKLSICIPTYNRAAYIGETLASIISQSNDDIEIVIVDGASTDNTADVVTSFKVDLKIYIIIVKNRIMVLMRILPSRLHWPRVNIAG